jgi:hypothetical protein
MLLGLQAGSPPFTHLSRLTDERGLFEHADFDEPRLEHGYCVDDVARGLLVTVREGDSSPRIARMTETYLGFLESAIVDDGSAHNRMDASGAWIDHPGHGDWWGRAVQALGTTAVHAQNPLIRERAIRAFTRATRRTSPDLRAMVFAALGASEVLSVAAPHGASRRIIERAVAMMPPPSDPDWPWPEPRLRYSNGSIPEMFIACGVATRNRKLLDRGLGLLDFLLTIETNRGHLSVTGTKGRGPGERSPQFDQQPIEVATIADACARAFDATRDERWLDGVRLAWKWFLGDNDSSTPMFDVDTGAGHDGLTPTGRNENRGAESTLAALDTFQQARRVLGTERQR